ncbi:oxygen-independent coproporphyrinogen III oxidase [Propionivibrio sp.]|uniref:oxygen-independent coproporphyrinogen III oxidase n=1 Tax=Propionivibrio sp. TaxID=2212460 RepID=UPI0025F48B81|nr:oxygen-independent coproporphyrinogen III oxidase [Propionivibrio sp.]MBK7356440.1 oxygen-independent coproporphyrinogen III oxidase [Propionivibrio sp.]MBL0207911.1 oxygen-independent coproporphyrinogen III oxidase [Propionivibrio sp.]
MITAAGNLVFDPQIIRRFDINGPRYTSYPTADRFVETFDTDSCGRFLENRVTGSARQPISLYFHIPFCNTICYYCACNKIITKDHGRSAKYLKYLAKELALQSGFLQVDDKAVAQLHWGGGTPTFLSHDEMRQLMAATRRHFRLIDDGEYSIEVDPRKVDRATVELLGELGFNRMSVGVQDFDESVQRAVNRIQSEEETFAVIDSARANGFKSVSIDLIYGLPRQTVTGFSRTLDRVISASPDRLSIYNYAHLPSLFKPQRRILESDMPSADNRLQILALAIGKLTEAGYVYIGMDHFAKPSDELAVAQRAGRLHRNFQGYSTYSDCDMMSFGISSISKVGPTYYQNVKTLDEYYEQLDKGKLPVYRGIELNADDILRRSIIQALMCHFELSMAAVEAQYDIDFRTYFSFELEALREMVQAGLLLVEDKRIIVLPAGRMLVRAISMVFDSYLRTGQEQKRYSKVI